MSSNTQKSQFTVNPIGHVKAKGESYSIHIDRKYRKGLRHMDQFSHVLVFWWASEHDNSESRSILETDLPYTDNLTAGVFACRSEYRPNPVAVTVCTCLNMDMEKGIIRVPYMDAFDGTPVIDLKPYFPVSDRVRDTQVPSWVKEWPEWYEDAYKMAEIFSECGS